MSSEIDNIEESRKDRYIETHFLTLKESLDNIQVYFRTAMNDARFIEKLIESKNKAPEQN